MRRYAKRARRYSSKLEKGEKKQQKLEKTGWEKKEGRRTGVAHGHEEVILPRVMASHRGVVIGGNSAGMRMMRMMMGVGADAVRRSVSVQIVGRRVRRSRMRVDFRLMMMMMMIMMMMLGLMVMRGGKRRGRLRVME